MLINYNLYLMIIRKMDKNMSTAQNVGSNFNIDQYLIARELTKKSLRETAKKVNIGMTEQDIEKILLLELEKNQFLKFWHPTKIRMNTNTIKNFRDPSDLTKLNESDIYFIDIGPVFLDHEGDYGETFIIGNDKK